MPDIVIDASAILAVLLEEPERGALIEATQDADLHAPASTPWEVGNAVAALVKRRRLTEVQAMSVLRAYSGITLRTLEIRLDRAVLLALSAGLYAYDGYMLEAARASGYPLLTLDGKLQAAARSLRLPLIEVPR